LGRFWLDTDFAGHAKLLALGAPAKRWTWLEVLIYTCKYGSPEVPTMIREVVPRATGAFLKDCVRLGLLDQEGDRLLVHDWYLYQGTVEERVGAFLERHPAASANEVQQAVAGRREAVLAAVNRFRNGSGGGSTEPPNLVPKVVPSALASALEGLAPLSETQSPTSYEGGRDFTSLDKLAFACRAHVGASEKIKRAARGCSEADLIGALEACRGPGVKDRLAVALSELKKRRAA